MKCERNRHYCNVYLTLSCIYKGYGYCNYNCAEEVKVKIYVYSSSWSVQPED